MIRIRYTEPVICCRDECLRHFTGWYLDALARRVEVVADA